MNTVIIDTNVFVAALRSQGGASRQILRLALTREIQSIFGNALWLEYEDLLGRDVWGNATNDAERRQVLGSLCQVSRWVTVYY
ncbi:MAG: PIN domain-containing protein, partial [Methylococcales bacterium]